MKRDEAARRIRQHRTDFEPFGVATLSLIGSVARNEAGPESDVDVLVDFTGVPTLEQYMGLKWALEKALDAPVDLVDRAALHPRWRQLIEESAREMSSSTATSRSATRSSGLPPPSEWRSCSKLSAG